MEEENRLRSLATPVIYSNSKPKPYNPLRRPTISYKKPAICLAVYIVLTVTLGVLSGLYLPKLWWIAVLAIFSVIYISIIAKRTIIWLVHLYQNRASDRIRLKCVFEPSCSEYMILAVEKYGVIKGVHKGIDRLLRCHSPNGGKDYP